ncbi:putative major intrinsic protein [Helianthus annuus]|uniref:Major intrinsic protein n=1 Tax=Helianthus annuus TaxID=4232 RepID=A0A251VS51_HELAN|nr:aquaporin SIP1-1 [Helianthus annuus]KAF5823294.1 putative major intrinsic protein [Helianthus annuus]KAJ0612660.1 putative major intrinsic protein [Helianthus annuus]KAJ0624200.1 putative major intrinsic protein [Helianthus annuus]KAJ0628022.1 putative major intrinsic protein [Helianthus annuus]KAJ0784314.1 putative major intrinsic protein [Helianthus annuus]
MGVVKAAIGDGVLTFMWVFCASTLGAGTSVIAKAVGVHGTASLLITVGLVFVLLLVFGIIGDLLGGASFNPTGTAAFYAAGLGRDTLISAAVRFPAQALGAVGGALAIIELMPLDHKHLLGGPSLKVDLHTGAIAEGVLTFVMSFLVLFIILKGPKNPLIKNLMLSMSIVTMVVLGSGYSGPSMNPANAFGWAYVNNRHNTWEHFLVYWICPFIGAIFAGWVFRVFFPKPSKKKKTA